MHSERLGLESTLEERLQTIKQLRAAAEVAGMQDAIRGVAEEFGPAALGYIRARMYEDGVFGRVDVDAAIKDFSAIAEDGGDLISGGLVGLARMLYIKDSDGNSNEVISLCMKSVETDSNPMGMMLLAAVHADVHHDYRSAKKWSMRAFKNRSPWGLPYCAVISYREKRTWAGILFEVAAFLTRPFMSEKYKARGPFK